MLAALTAQEKEIAGRVEARAKDALTLLQKAVDIPSATQDLAAVRAAGDLFRGELTRLGFATRWMAMPQGMHRAGHLRFLTNQQRERAKEKMRAIVAWHLPGTSATIEFDDSCPAMSPTKGNDALLSVLDGASRDLGQGPVPALDPGERGAGDVSFVAPCADSLHGIGARGDGSHTPDETVELASLPSLIKRTAILSYRLTR